MQKGDRREGGSEGKGQGVDFVWDFLSLFGGRDTALLT